MKKKLVLAALLSGAVVVFGDGFSLTNELVVLSLDARGWSTQLVERATEPCRYAPSQGLTEVPPLVTRPGETALPEFEVTGPIGAFEVSIGGVTR